MEILPHFWVSYYNENYNIIKEKKIKNIIHLSKNKKFIKKLDLDEIRIPIDYEEDEPMELQNNMIYQNLFDVTDYIHEKIINNEKVMLLGQNNKQDIDVFIVAYLIRFGKLNIQNSILFLKSKKKNIFYPKCLFFFALNKFYNQLNKNY
jgi:hypothetical protein